MPAAERRNVVLVTGAGTGPGRAVVAELRARGMCVVGDDLGSGKVGLHAHLQCATEIAAMMGEIKRRHGGLDALVACHAEPEPTGLFDEDSRPFWRQIDGMLTSSFLVVQGAAELLAESGQGRVVLLSSGWSTGARDLAGLSAASAGIDLLVRGLACELGPRGIAVNAVAPAFLDDPQWLACDAAALGLSQEGLRSRAAEIVPSGALGSCEAMARLVALLCRPDLGAAIGQTIHCSGGYFRHRL